MTTVREPRTEAGRTFIEEYPHFAKAIYGTTGLPVILAIEAEATRLALEDVAERVRGLPGEYCLTHEGSERTVNRAAVLALFSTEEEGS